MSQSLPDDADGDALRRLVADGSDLSREMEIDFAVDAPDGQAAQAFAELAVQHGFHVSISEDEESGRWSCYCSKTLIPRYADIVAIQVQLDELGKPLNARSDGWGSWGNAPPASQP